MRILQSKLHAIKPSTILQTKPEQENTNNFEPTQKAKERGERIVVSDETRQKISNA